MHFVTFSQCFLKQISKFILLNYMIYVDSGKCLFGSVPNRSAIFTQGPRRLSSRFVCEICRDILMDPIQTECGCRFCSSCINLHISTVSNICPGCQSHISQHNFTKDKAVEKEIFNLEIVCVNDQCNQIMILRDLEEHLKMCDYRKEKCESCGESFIENERERHMNELCKRGIVKCDNCGLEMTREEKEEIHENIDRGIETLCEKMRGKCPYKCDDVVYENVKLHLFECGLRPISCPLLDVGCNVVIPSNDVSHHMEINSFPHQILMMNEINRLRKENENLKHSFELSNEQMKEEIRFLKQMNSELMMNVNKFQKFSNENCSKIENIKSEVDRYKEIIEDLHVNNENEVSISNGECSWTIRDIRQKIHSAKHGGETQIISKPFYISTPGYKFQLKIYPNGDGRGRDNYLSIYFVIVRGDYDDVLSWPFKEKITLSIVSTRGSFGDVRIHMRPDDNESCYGRPNERGNIGAGQPEFIKLSELLNKDEFLHEGSLKVKVTL